MKSLMIVIVAMCLSSVVYAQDAPAPPDPRVAELQEANKNLIARLSKLEQKLAPSAGDIAEQAAKDAEAVCARRGQALAGTQIEAATGKTLVLCKPKRRRFLGMF